MTDQSTRDVRWARRSLLYMPGARLEMYPKAVASGADVVCVDLEDAVAADAKDAVRLAVLDLFSEAAPDDGIERLIRINSPATAAGKADLEALAASAARPDGVVIPKCRAPEDVAAVAAALAGDHAGLLLHPLIESAAGVEAAFEIATADPRVGFLMLGSQDLATELRCEHTWEPLYYSRARMVAAAASAARDVLDAGWFDLSDNEGLAAEAVRAKAMGFTGKGAIHPKQIAPINGAFSPSAEEVAEARALIDKFEAQDKAAAMIDGVFMEAPVVARLKRTLAIGERIGL